MLTEKIQDSKARIGGADAMIDVILLDTSQLTLVLR